MSITRVRRIKMNMKTHTHLLQITLPFEATFSVPGVLLVARETHFTHTHTHPDQVGSHLYCPAVDEV